MSDGIDVVYLWVNGSDREWQAKRDKMVSIGRLSHDDLAPYGNVGGRYRDNGELRYNLRALERFFPEHGHVYVVTDGQRTTARPCSASNRSTLPNIGSKRFADQARFQMQLPWRMIQGYRYKGLPENASATMFWFCDPMHGQASFSEKVKDCDAITGHIGPRARTLM